MPTAYDRGAAIRRTHARRAGRVEEGMARQVDELTAMFGPLQRQVVRDHPKPYPRRHPARLIVPPVRVSVARWAGRELRALAAWVWGWGAEVRGLGRLRVSRGRQAVVFSSKIDRLRGDE